MTGNCGKTVDTGCSSVIFPSHGDSYSKVCGRVYGYQKATTDAFRGFACPGCAIDQQYVDGVSITHGSPRQHIWSLAASHLPPHCQCNSNNINAPSFVGQDYFCDVEGTSTYTTADRLWDALAVSLGLSDAVRKARGSVRIFPSLPLTTLSSDSVPMKTEEMKMCILNTLSFMCIENTYTYVCDLNMGTLFTKSCIDLLYFFCMYVYEFMKRFSTCISFALPEGVITLPW